MIEPEKHVAIISLNDESDHQCNYKNFIGKT